MSDFCILLFSLLVYLKASVVEYIVLGLYVSFRRQPIQLSRVTGIYGCAIVQNS